ncbi:MAG: hypothetical protein IJN16_08990 [Lachnospiraceae bacterium]|nr:hypothetical protein [Lachnospiraceae bacterium]MBQ6696824.1 hypothetical protein [Lachnospiraceae bacterium]
MLAYCRKTHSIAAKDLSHIREYTKEDLMKPEEIELNYRCIYRYDIHITKSGWEFLIEYYGYEGLYEIDKRCNCWFSSGFLRDGGNNSLEEYIKWINGRIKCYPDVPDFVYKDDRPKNIAKTLLQVKDVEEVAELFEMSVECVLELDRELKEERAEYEKEQRKKLVPSYLRAGKTIEEIAEELDIAIDYVRELDIKMKESQLKAEKAPKTVYALRAGRTAEEVAKEIEMPLEFVLEIERKIKK